MSRVEVDPERVREEILEVSSPSISKKEYQEKVESLAEEAMESYPENPIHEKVFEVADQWVSEYDCPLAAILHHSQSKPSNLKPFVEGSNSDGILSGLAFIHLERDIQREVWSRRRNSMEELVDELLDEYSNVSGIHVLHPPRAQDADRLEIVVQTPDAQSVGREPEKYQKHTFVDVEGGEYIGQLGFPFDIKLTTGSGSVEGSVGTTLYRKGRGSKYPRPPKQGVSRLRKKMKGVCPDCGLRTEEGGTHV